MTKREKFDWKRLGDGTQAILGEHPSLKAVTLIDNSGTTRLAHYSKGWDDGHRAVLGKHALQLAVALNRANGRQKTESPCELVVESHDLYIVVERLDYAGWLVAASESIDAVKQLSASLKTITVKDRSIDIVE